MPPTVIAASDVGGTFTDVVAYVGGRVVAAKLPTDAAARHAPAAAGIEHAIRQAGKTPVDLARVVHATTAATNALLQRRGARVGLVTNQGFEDMIEIGRQARPSLYDLHVVRPSPLVPRPLRVGVPGRLDHTGKPIQDVDRDAVVAAARALRRRKAEAVAVSMLHSYANDDHERRVAAILRECGHRRVTIGSEIDPEFREYERTSTAVANAFLLPVMEGYVRDLDAALHALGSVAPLSIVESGGGLMPAAEAARAPVRTALSGPAAGVAAAAETARRLGIRRALTFDMGGTSTDLAVLTRGHAHTRHEAEVGGIPLRAPMVDVVTIGAGGGSIASIDPGGVLRVGPASAEAVPGPACYGRGGLEPTVTDADLVLGRIEPKHFLGGSGAIGLQPVPARQALGRLGDALGIGATAAARQVLDVAAEGLRQGIRLATTRRGLDPAEHTMVAFGGAGPLHGIGAAASLQVRRVIVPKHCSVFSAWGMLVAPHRRTFAAAALAVERSRPFGAATKHWARLAGRADDAGSLPAGHRGTRWRRIARMRYVGQSHELDVSVSDDGQAALQRAAGRFHAIHRARFGHADRRRAVQLVALRLETSTPTRPHPRLKPIDTGSARPPAAALLGSRRSWWPQHGTRTWPIYERAALRSGNRIRGPAWIEGGDHTVPVPPRAVALVREHGELEVVLG